jgi:hypothetical protein
MPNRSPSVKRFAEIPGLVAHPIKDLDAQQLKAFALQSFEAMVDSLQSGRALTAELIIQSTWNQSSRGLNGGSGLCSTSRCRSTTSHFSIVSNS